MTEIPIIVCRAFHTRLSALKTFLRSKFGGLLYEISVVEFQKRGLPHAHIVVKFKYDPPLSAIDSLISTELPDYNQYPDLYKQVRTFHLHSKDHLSRPGSRCSRNGRCIYNYPLPITPYTHVDDLGRLHYRRRKEEDRWVTPYIPALLQTLDCHIYCDICSSATIFLYLFKYLFKGPDQAKFSFRNLSADTEDFEVVDEFQDYMNSRYLSTSEGVYRILGFNIVYKNPSVRCLPVHLENKNLPRMKRTHAMDFSTLTDLLCYFKRPTNEMHQNLTYANFFSRFYIENLSLDQPLDKGQIPIANINTEQGIRQKVLRERSKGSIVTRLQTTPIRQKELFYMRALLQARSATSFEDLRTIQDHCYPTYHEAATAFGLFRDVNEAEYALLDAMSEYCGCSYSLETRPQLRSLLYQRTDFGS